MAKAFFQVFEHDRLVLKDKPSGSVFEAEHLQQLENHCNTHNEKYYSIIRNGVRFKSYVGVIQIGKTVIEILPKADRAIESNDVNLNKWQDILFQMLRFTGNLKTDATNSADLKARKHSLLDLFFAQFVQECDYLVHRGLIKQYRKEQGQVKALKGRMVFAQHLRCNVVHKERFYTEHVVYDRNHLINRLLHTTLLVLQRLSFNPHLNNQISDLLLRFPAWPPLSVSENTFTRIPQNRKTEPYKKALQLSRFILLNYHPDLKTGREDMISLLFNMNNLWEAYVRKQLTQYLALHPESRVSVKFQRSKTFWTSSDQSYSSSMSPDIILKTPNGKVIIDTKWKQVDYTNPSEQDLRQLFAYCLYWKAKQGYLLYPTVNDKEPKVEGNYREGFEDVKAGILRLDVPKLIETEKRLALGEELFGLISER
jgi:5-methylcytosine-specific restriction enzyme subunit McrC